MYEVALGFWQFSLVFGLGLFLGVRILRALPFGYRVATSFALGFSTFSILFFLLGLVGGLRFWVLVPLSLLLTPLAAWGIGREGSAILRSVQRAAKESPFAVVLIGILSLIYFLGACVPEREEDAIWYHLGVPIHYLFHGGFIREVPFHLPSHYPMYGQLHYTLSLLVGNDSTAKVFAFCQLFPTLILIHSVLKRFGHPQTAIYGCLFYLCCVHFRLPVMANVQRISFFLTLLSTVLVWEALDRRSIRILVMAAVACGMAIGTKMNALLFGYVLQTILILGWGAIVRPGWGNALRYLITHTALAWALLSPWLVKSFLVTGNPFYPMLSNVFGSKPPFREAMEATSEIHGITVLKVDSLSGVWDQTLRNLDTIASETDLLSILSLVCLPILGLIGPRKNGWIVASSGLAILFLTQLWGHTVGRLFAINAGLFSILIAATLSELTRTGRSDSSNVSRFLPPFVALLIFSSFLYVQYHKVQGPGVDWMGVPTFSEESRDRWRVERGVRTRDSIEMERWMNENIPPDDEVYVFPIGYLSSLQRKFVASDRFFGERLLVWVEEGSAGGRLDDLDVRWILVDRMNTAFIQGTALDNFLATDARPTKTIGTQTLFKRDLD